MKKSCCLIALLFGANAWAQTKAPSLEERVKRLEEQVKEDEAREADLSLQYAEHKGSVRTFLGNRLAFGGFFEGAMTALNGPDTESQLSAHSNILGLNISAEFEEQIRFVSQFLTGLTFQLENPHNNPALTPNHRQFRTPSFGAIVAQAYAEYFTRPEFRVQMGLGYAPYGHSFQQREPVLFRRRGGPQMASAGSSRSIGIASPLWMGFHIHGAFPTQTAHWGYNAYSFTPGSNPKTLGAGARLWWEPLDRMTVGLSGQTGKQGDDTFNSLGADLDWSFRQGGITIEYARSYSVNGNGSVLSYYAEPYLNLYDGRYVIYAAADYIDNPSYVAGAAATPDPYEKWVLGAGLNWLPVSYTRFRLGYASHDYLGQTASIGGQIRRYHSLDISIGVAF